MPNIFSSSKMHKRHLKLIERQYIPSCTVASTMGSGVKVSTAKYI